MPPTRWPWLRIVRGICSFGPIFRTRAMSDCLSVTPVRVSTPTRLIDCSTLFTPPRRRAWVSACRSADPSFKDTRGVCGPKTTKAPEQRSASVFRSTRGHDRTERLQQDRIVKRFWQTGGRAKLDYPRPKYVILGRCDENDRDPLTLTIQFSLQLDTRHARHRDVEKQAFGLVHRIGREE